MNPPYTPLKGEAPLEEKSFYSGEYLIKRKIESIPKLLDPLFPRVGSVAIAGSSDLGKSTLLRQLALAVSVGDSSFLGWKLNPIHKSAMVVSTEDFADLMTITLKTFNKEKKLHTSKYENIHFIFVIENLLEKLDPKERIELLIKLMPYVCPKIQTASHSLNEPMDFNF